MNRRRQTLAGLVLAVLWPLALAQSEDEFPNAYTLSTKDVPADAPRFAQYPARADFKGKPAKPDVHSHPRSRMFRTMIREGAAKGPDFAGYYTVVTWGCGAGCVSFAIVDARTGRVFHPQAPKDVAAMDHSDGLETIEMENADFDSFKARGIEERLNYRSNSRLFIIIGSINECGKTRGIYYFLWNHDRLRLLRRVLRPDDPKYGNALC